MGGGDSRLCDAGTSVLIIQYGIEVVRAKSGASVCLSPGPAPRHRLTAGRHQAAPTQGTGPRPHSQTSSTTLPPQLDTATVIVRTGQGLSVDARARHRRHPRPLPPGRHHLRLLHSDRPGRRGRVGRGVLRPGRYPAPARRPARIEAVVLSPVAGALCFRLRELPGAVHDFGWCSGSSASSRLFADRREWYSRWSWRSTESRCRTRRCGGTARRRAPDLGRWADRATSMLRASR